MLLQQQRQHIGIHAGAKPYCNCLRPHFRARRAASGAYKSGQHTSHSSAQNECTTTSTDQQIHNGRLPYWEFLEELTRPASYQIKVLQGHKFAWGRSLLAGKDMLFVADAELAQYMLRNETAFGIKTSFPETFIQLLGEKQVNLTQDPELHTHLRQIMSPYFTSEAIQRIMPDIHATVAKHMARWAADSAAKPVDGYAACKSLTFDVMANQGLQLGMNQDEVAEYSQIFATWTAGLMPPALNLPIFPFGRGLKARDKLIARVEVALKDPDIPPNSLPARLRDEYGPESDVAHHNMIGILFAGHDTTSSAMSFMLSKLMQYPDVLQRLREEQAAVLQQHGPDLTPRALSAMPYTSATVKETLRLARIVPGLLRKTTQPITSRNCTTPTVPSSCPFIVATSAMAIADPAVSEDSEEFKPERWLDPKHAKSLAVHQLPFGAGQHYCLGSHLATAELTAAVAVLARGYELQADMHVVWVDFPIKKPSKFFGVKLISV